MKSFIARITSTVKKLDPKTLFFLMGNGILIGLIIWSVSFLIGGRHPEKDLISYASTDPQIIAEARQIYATCAQKKFSDCYETELSSLVRSKRFKYSSATLIALQDIDERVKSCHVIAHEMGRALFNSNPSRWHEFAKEVDVSVCASGFLHGILEARLANDSDFQVNASFINEFCDSGNDYLRSQMCSHFMGHLALLNIDGNLPAALPTCEGVKNQFQLDCYIGIFMEDHQKRALAEHGIASLPSYTRPYVDSLREQCNSYHDQLGVACWIEMGEIYAKLYDYDAPKVYRGCYKEPSNEAQRRGCYQKGLAVLVTYPLPREPQQLLDICNPFVSVEEKYLECLGTAFGALLNYSPKFIDRGITMCQYGRKMYAENCFKKLGLQLQSFVPSITERMTLCSPAPEQYKQLCASNNIL